MLPNASQSPVTLPGPLSLNQHILGRAVHTPGHLYALQLGKGLCLSEKSLPFFSLVACDPC